jgi:ribosomal protein L9
MKNLDKELESEEKFIIPLLEVVKDKRGMKHALKYSQEYILNFLIERGVLSESREKLIQELRNNTNYEPREIMELINSYFKWKEALPEFSLRINQRLDEASERYGTHFEKVGKKVLGIIQRDNQNLVVDVSGINEMVLAEVNNQGITWKNNEISTPEMRWVVENTKHRMGVSL